MRPGTINGRPVGGGGSTDIAATIHEATGKTTPIDADELGLYDSVAAALKKLTWANLKATLAAVFAQTAADYASLADGGYIARKTRTGVAGETIATFQSCYLKAADGKYWLAKGDAAATMSATEIVLALDDYSADDPMVGMEEGYFRDDSLAAGFATKGASYYVSEATAGLLTTTIPTTVGNQVMVLGAVTEVAKICHFAPTGVIVEVGDALPTFPTGTIVGTTDSQTLTNKRVTKRTGGTMTIASSATPTPDVSLCDIFIITALAEAAEFQTPIGTPLEGDRLLIRIKDNASARALTFVAAYRFGTDLIAPTTTVISKTMYLNFVYNYTDSKWDYIGQIGNI